MSSDTSILQENKVDSITRTSQNYEFEQAIGQKRESSDIQFNHFSKLIQQQKTNSILAPFNCLPYGIKKQIFCYLDCTELPVLKDSVCLHWYEIINQLLDIQFVCLDYEKKEGASDLSAWFDNQRQFILYRASHRVENIINLKTISNLVQDYLNRELYEINYERVFDFLEDNARNILDTSPRFENIVDIVWQYILRMTRWDYPLEDLRKRSIFDSEIAERFMTQFRWYVYRRVQLSYEGDDRISLIALYPDRQTFAIVSYPDIETYDSDEEDFLFF